MDSKVETLDRILNMNMNLRKINIVNYHHANKYVAIRPERRIFSITTCIQKTKIMASGPITSQEIDGETVSDFILGGSKITADGDCSHEIKRRLLFGRKFMTNLLLLLSRFSHVRLCATP